MSDAVIIAASPKTNIARLQLKADHRIPAGDIQKSRLCAQGINLFGKAGNLAGGIVLMQYAFAGCFVDHGNCQLQGFLGLFSITIIDCLAHGFNVVTYFCADALVADAP